MENENQGIGTQPGLQTGYGDDRSRASARVQSAWESGRAQAGSTAQKVKYKLTQAGTQAKKKLAAARTTTTAKAQQVRVGTEHRIQAHPLKAVGIAFGAGAVLGLLLRRKR